MRRLAHTVRNICMYKYIITLINRAHISVHTHETHGTKHGETVLH